MIGIFELNGTFDIPVFARVNSENVTYLEDCGEYNMDINQRVKTRIHFLGGDYIVVDELANKVEKELWGA